MEIEKHELEKRSERRNLLEVADLSGLLRP